MNSHTDSKEYIPIHAHFFFVDIVSLSDPTRGTTEDQIEKIKILHKFISECKAYSETPEDKKYVNLTGDGMVIGFLEGPALPLDLAIDLQKKLNHHNLSKKSEDKIEIRIGLDTAPIKFYTDILNNENVWGYGIIIAKRVMDLGDARHILLTDRIAKGLRQFSAYRDILHEVAEYPVKHGEFVMIWNAFGIDFGNTLPPKEHLQKNKVQGDSRLVPGIEVSGDSIKFISAKLFEFSTIEAIGIVLYVTNAPLSPQVIDNILTREWKKVSNVSQYLVVNMKKHVTKVDLGYILTGEGRHWIEKDVIPKLKAN